MTWPEVAPLTLSLSRCAGEGRSVRYVRSVFAERRADGAIHRAAGPDLLTECLTLGGYPTGQAKLTKAYRLPAKYVSNAVGPRYRDGKCRQPELLANCYRASLALAMRYRVASIAFPEISCGIYGYPIADAARIAVRTIAARLEIAASIAAVILACCSQVGLFACQTALRDAALGDLAGRSPHCYR